MKVVFTDYELLAINAIANLLKYKNIDYVNFNILKKYGESIKQEASKLGIDFNVLKEGWQIKQFLEDTIYFNVNTLNEGIILKLKDEYNLRYLENIVLKNDELNYIYQNEVCLLELGIDKKIKQIDILEVIEKVVESKMFFENIALNLSKEEYEMIANIIKNKNCFNCQSECKKDTICDKWKNDEMVGKSKLLKKYSWE